jgi:hypothetical protein
MSEYQCHEFVAVDRTLTPKDMAALRSISTRAEITPTRFWNEYNWGDLKADPATLLARYFDAYAFDVAWTKLEALIDAKEYDTAMKLALDLRDLAARDGSAEAFAASFTAMRKRQLRRREFFDHWKRENAPSREGTSSAE